MPLAVTAARRTKPRLCDLLWRYGIGEARRIERIQAAVRGFGVGIHQKADRPFLLARQGEVAGIVEPDPIHFPTAERRSRRPLTLSLLSRTCSSSTTLRTSAGSTGNQPF